MYNVIYNKIGKINLKCLDGAHFFKTFKISLCLYNSIPSCKTEALKRKVELTIWISSHTKQGFNHLNETAPLKVQNFV